MYKKLIISFGAAIISSLIGIVICVFIMMSSSLSTGVETDFWNKTEGKYEVYYTIEGTDSMSSSMIETYIEPIIYIEFNNSDVTITTTLNVESEKDSMLYILDTEFKGLLLVENDNKEITVYSYTTQKTTFKTDTLSFKVSIGSMPFSPEFSLKLSLDSAYLVV